MSIPEPAAMRVTAGVDWAKDDHVVCVVGEQGEVIDRFTVHHDARRAGGGCAVDCCAPASARSASNAGTGPWSRRCCARV